MVSYLKNLLAFRRVIGDHQKLRGLTRADALLSDLTSQGVVPGISVTVLKQGKLLIQQGYGYADLDKKVDVDPKTTIFRAASVSKPIAATALAKMVAEGTISLDDSVYDHLPYFPKKQADISLRQLAGHTAGIRGYKGKEYALNRPYSIKDSLEIFQDDELLFDPGTGYHYNSYDWVLVSLAMQEACGLPFADYVEEKVLKPLGMQNTFPEHSIKDLPNVDSESNEYSRSDRIATFYSRNLSGFRRAVTVNNAYKLAGGGYLSTSEDIARLGQAYLEGKISSKEVLSDFLSSQKVKGQPTYYGLGWQVSEDKKGRPYYGHVGNGVGGYSNFFIYPEQQLVVAILINCTNPNVQDTLDEVVEALHV
ncbi:serine hydrolase [Flavobacteriaceae bacterium R33]|uniref:Serine hydrolase n=1 Tax=Poritiphilus flavus TaxID=2697053 RepID=A0A6L9EH47_9FLAO|nr:serine hydrolase [Poritiphilus flavus]